MINLNTIVLGNTVLDYIYAVGIFAGLVLFFKAFQYIVLRRLKKAAEKTETDIDDTLIKIVHDLKPPFYYFLAFYLATYSLYVVGWFKTAIGVILTLVVIYQIVAVTKILTEYILNKKVAKNDEDEESVDAAINIIGKIVQFALWLVGLLMILSNLGINITSLVAGLGIGGIAIAFALQSILEDLFSSFTIFFDKPFKVGDFIIVGGDAGTVEKIGIKTSRIRTVQGEELVVSNKELTSTRIQNFKRMEERRGLFSFGVTYETPVSKLRQIPVYVKQIVESVKDVRFDRAHFKDFGDSALNYEVVYYINSSAYADFMDAQQEMNLKIMEKFEQEGIEMAYPTRTVFVKNSS
ncbi:MAG: mechanosensitive ion channel family protein [Candidatus Pacebacteria bacterium]|nr:mechanosensitive ion channel family protein [Candidatus Paceibacterota bacterium]